MRINWRAAATPLALLAALALLPLIADAMLRSAEPAPLDPSIGLPQPGREVSGGKGGRLRRKARSAKALEGRRRAAGGPKASAAPGPRREAGIEGSEAASPGAGTSRRWAAWASGSGHGGRGSGGFGSACAGGAGDRFNATARPRSAARARPGRDGGVAGWIERRPSGRLQGVRALAGR